MPWQHYRWLLLAVVGLAAASALLTHRWRPLLVGAGCALLVVAMRARRAGKDTDTVATPDRISRPIRGGDIFWSDVAYVVQPGRFDSVVQVRTLHGSLKATGFPPEYAERLAEIGGRPLRQKGSGPQP